MLRICKSVALNDGIDDPLGGECLHAGGLWFLI